MENQKDQQKQIPKVPGLRRVRKPSPIGWLILILLIMSFLMAKERLMPVDEIKYGTFVNYVEQGYVKSVEIGTSTITGKYTEDGFTAILEQNPEAASAFKSKYNPEVLSELTKNLNEKDVEYGFVSEGLWVSIIVSIAPFLILIVLFWFIFARNVKGGPGGMLMNFGRSKHRLQDKDKSKVTFDDVAGIEEAKEEVTETIEFLKNPKRFMKIGGRIPRGILLEGPPGCGKTLLAKAIAGQAGVPFFSISGSDFVEMFVGVGASRVRDLFSQAKQNSPCIIFLDEIDAIGKKRGPGIASGGHDEREQTLNAILVEMDGFDTSDQVIVVAATNRVDILDKALTRPGRFDRQIYVPLPDINGRLEILKVHSKKVKLGPDVKFERIARGTPMFTGAELEALINEAAIAATMANKDFVEQADLEEARDKVRWGRAKKSRNLDLKDKQLTAYHEAGHTLVQCSLKDADPLHKVSIIPRGPMGGATFSLPEKDRTHYTKKFCSAFLQVCFGGRIAEEIFCDDISSGAQGDIKQATEMARTMVLQWGMSDQLGLVNLSGKSDYSEYNFGQGSELSEETARLVDREIKRFIDDAYNKAKELILAHKDDVENIAQALLKYETLDADEVMLILEGKELAKPTVTELLEIEKTKLDNQKSEVTESQESASSDEQAASSQEPKEGESSEENSNKESQQTEDSQENEEDYPPAQQ